MLYRHFKGGTYRVLCAATLEATGEEMVVYQSQQDGHTWVRPYTEFLGEVQQGRARVPRFEPVKAEEEAG